MRAANLLKQEMLSKGGEAALTHGAADWSVERTDALLMGTLKQYRLLLAKLKLQPFGLARLGQELSALLDAQVPEELRLGPHRLPLSRILVMGILNITPDSFSDGGRYSNVEQALKQGEEMVAQGADIIDVGGESTRPGHEPVSVDEELKRVMPVIERLTAELSVPISIDTNKVPVAAKALSAGVHLVNDVGGLASEDMLPQVTRNGAGLVIMHGLKEHRREAPRDYPDLMGTLNDFLAQRLEQAIAAGVPRESIILDPGLGFGKHGKRNLTILARLGELTGLGQPLLVGSSRKGFIGEVLDVPVEEREEGTAATVALAIANGAHLIRVHNVKSMVRVARMTDAILAEKDHA